MKQDNVPFNETNGRIQLVLDTLFNLRMHLVLAIDHAEKNNKPELLEHLGRLQIITQQKSKLLEGFLE